MNHNETNSRTHCIRCGTCCEKGGPALHTEDLDLVLRQLIPAADLYTIRYGELVRDNINGGLVKTRQEIIKVKAAKGSNACAYYGNPQQGCRIYENRPLECRVMQCWDTRAIESVYALNRLDRTAIFSRIEWLMELIRTHEARCSYDRLQELVRMREEGETASVDQILEMVRYDDGMREAFAQKSDSHANMVDLLFGRSLKHTIPIQFAIKLTPS